MRWLAVVALASCATAPRAPYQHQIDQVLAQPRTPGLQIAGPEVFAPAPWKPGQWARYRTPGGIEMRKVLAIDACGIWTEQIWLTPAHELIVRVCFRTQPTPDNAVDEMQEVIGIYDHGRPIVVNFRDPKDLPLKPRYAYLAHDLAGVATREDMPREDVAVPAGRFAQAIHAGETWVHGAVPIDGRVKRVHGTETDELLAFGEDHDGDVVSDLDRQRWVYPPILGRVEIGGGFGRWTGIAHGNTAAFGMNLVQPMRRRLELVAALTFPDRGRGAMAPEVFEMVTALRWRPLRDRTLFVQAGLGIGLLDDPSTDDQTDAMGLIIGAAVGWFPLETPAMAVGIQLGDNAGVYNNDWGTHHDLSACVLARLNIFR